MQQLEPWRARQAVLPLPPASLVIDLRADEDDMVERLKIEITDLTNEMKIQETHHWRLLADFLSFWRVPPLGTGEIQTLRAPQQTPGQNGAVSVPASTGTQVAPASSAADHVQASLTGLVIPSMHQASNSTLFFDDGVNLGGFSGDQPSDILAQYIEQIIHETNRLRNNRAVAMTDLSAHLVAPSMRDKAVRIIFVVDAEQPDSLASAAAYAERLRQFRVQRQRAPQDAMLNTTVLCLNASGNAHSTELSELLWDDGWEHIDSLIISEHYRQDGVQIAGSIQTYLAELLLYVLLVVPPVPVNHVQPEATAPTAAPVPANSQGAACKEIAFPPNTFLIGLATMEHSARWGKHLLNFKVVERAIEVMQEDCEREREQTGNAARAWLGRWREKLRSMIPQHVPDIITGIRGLSNAQHVMKSPQQVFTVSAFSWSVGKTTMTDLQGYLATLTSTYIVQEPGRGEQKVLQHALDSLPQIEQQLHIWEGKEPDQRKEIPLANAQVEAQRVLSHPEFFAGARGAISRAKIQLEELSRAIIAWRSTIRPVDLKTRRQELEQKGQKSIQALEGDIAAIPRVGTLPFLSGFMAWLSLVLLLCMGVAVAFLAMAWLHHLFLVKGFGFVPLFDDVLLYSNSPLALVFWGVLLALVVVLIFLPGRRLLDSRRTAWNVEIGFVLVLLCLALFGWLLQFSLISLVDDPVSAALLGWLYFFPTVAVIAFVLAVLLVIGEICYFLWWFRHLQETRTRIVEELNALHAANIGAVNAFIADMTALFMLKRTELIDSQSEPGKYYERLRTLNDHLRELLKLAAARQAMVRRRLGLSFSETQPGAKFGALGPWLNLRIRDERLDIDTLADGYARLNARLGQEMVELRDLAEQLIRAMGQEQPALLEKEFRERSQAQYSLPRYPQVLMATLVATAQRVSIESDALTSIQPLIARYKLLEHSFPDQLYLMKTLIDTISRRLTRIMLEPVLDGQNSPSVPEMYKLSIDAFEIWGQMLWEHQDQALDRVLARTGVMPKLLNAQDQETFIKRLLALRTSLFGQNVQPGQVGDLLVLVPPSPQSHAFRQSLNISRSRLIEFPDVERLIMLYIQRYTAEPMQVALPPSPSTPPQP